MLQETKRTIWFVEVDNSSTKTTTFCEETVSHEHGRALYFYLKVLFCLGRTKPPSILVALNCTAGKYLFKAMQKKLHFTIKTDEVKS